jgi:hypothetical protein
MPDSIYVPGDGSTSHDMDDYIINVGFIFGSDLVPTMWM